MSANKPVNRISKCFRKPFFAEESSRHPTHPPIHPIRQEMAAPPDYDTLSRALLKQGHWHPVPRSWIQRLGLFGANFLSYIIMLGKSNAIKDGVNEGCIALSPDYVRRGICIPPNHQHELLKSFESLGLLQVKLINSIRHVRVVEHAIFDLFDEEY